MIQAKELYNNPSLNLQMETDFFKFLFYIYIPTQKINLGWNYFIAQKKKKKVRGPVSDYTTGKLSQVAQW